MFTAPLSSTLQKPEEVKEAILYALEHMGNAGRGGTEAALDASRSIYAVREKLADFFPFCMCLYRLLFRYKSLVIVYFSFLFPSNRNP